MMLRTKLPPRDYLLQCFRYDEATGNLISRDRPVHHFLNAHVAAIWNTKWAGKVRGVPDAEGYLIVPLERRKYRAHRLIWMMVFGEDAPEDIDHKNRNKSDNRISNLRACSRRQNSCNGPMRANNTSGIKGVGRFRGKWRARIKVAGTSIHLGIFENKQAAAEAFRVAALQHHGEYASY